MFRPGRKCFLRFLDLFVFGLSLTCLCSCLKSCFVVFCFFLLWWIGNLSHLNVFTREKVFSPVFGPLCIRPQLDLPHLCARLHHHHPLLLGPRQCHHTGIWDVDWKNHAQNRRKNWRFNWQVPEKCQGSETEGREAVEHQESCDVEQTLEKETRKDGLKATLLADQELKDRHKIRNQGGQIWDLTPWLVLYAVLTLLPGQIYINSTSYDSLLACSV